MEMLAVADLTDEMIDQLRWEAADCDDLVLAGQCETALSAASPFERLAAKHRIVAHLNLADAHAKA